MRRNLFLKNDHENHKKIKFFDLFILFFQQNSEEPPPTKFLNFFYKTIDLSQYL